MNKVEINELECRYPLLFKVMWISTVMWIVMSIANYFGNWLLPDRLDSIGVGLLFLFGVSIVKCFWNGVKGLVPQGNAIDILSLSPIKVASYAFVLSYTVMFIVSVLELCSPTDGSADSTRSVLVISFPIEVLLIIISDLLKAALFTVAAIILYWYVSICFVLFSGRIRRIGLEIGLAIVMISYIALCNTKHQLWINVVVALISMAFLFDIWHFAKFKKATCSISQMIKELEEEP